jgi:hypothetical protein
MGVGGQHHAPAAFTTGKDPLPIVQEAGWAPGQVRIGAENLAPLGLDPRTVQPIGSHYTNYTTLVFNYNKPKMANCKVSFNISFKLNHLPAFQSRLRCSWFEFKALANRCDWRRQSVRSRRCLELRLRYIPCSSLCCSDKPASMCSMSACQIKMFHQI